MLFFFRVHWNGGRFHLDIQGVKKTRFFLFNSRRAVSLSLSELFFPPNRSSHLGLDQKRAPESGAEGEKVWLRPACGALGSSRGARRRDCSIGCRNFSSELSPRAQPVIYTQKFLVAARGKPRAFDKELYIQRRLAWPLRKGKRKRNGGSDFLR